jgi:anthranilate phosphoribosyltransferase
MRHAVPVRRELGVATAFNFLGPLANPARVRRQVLGVGDPAMASRMIRVLAAGGATHAAVVYGADGLDELSTTGPSTMHALLGESGVAIVTVDPAALGLAPASVADLQGGDAETNAALARRVLTGEPGPHRDVVLLNAAAGLLVAGVVPSMETGLTCAASSIDDGCAATALDRLVAISQAAQSRI